MTPGISAPCVCRWRWTPAPLGRHACEGLDLVRVEYPVVDLAVDEQAHVERPLSVRVAGRAELGVRAEEGCVDGGAGGRVRAVVDHLSVDVERAGERVPVAGGMRFD